MKQKINMQIKEIIFFLTSGALFFPVLNLQDFPGATVVESNQTLVYRQDFSEDLRLEESDSMANSADAMWWLNSGAYFLQENGVGKTWQGELPRDSSWRKKYAISTPGSTSNGANPQNIFRLISRQRSKNAAQEVYFKINKYNLSTDEQRDASNGVLLFSRYADANNLYYAGIRVDGRAVVKKKIAGVYYTLASKSVFRGNYHRRLNPNLLPLDTWLGLRSEVRNLPNGTVEIRVFMDRSEGKGEWKEVLRAVDKGGKTGKVLSEAGFGGIRTDFMDVEFDDYQLTML